ncbi:MAG: TIM barrel protein [Paracoccaceae bacterium]|nr:TIM barrel protein [Paracoccaceae bacterium]
MTRFSANLGFLWTDRPLPEAIHAAKAAGFDAVECHWPYDFPPADVARALHETGLPMLGLNTRRGDVAGGESGLSALPGREEEACEAIDEALEYAQKTNTGAVHVMAGFAQGPAAEACFVSNLKYACKSASALGITILIEPLNHYDAPDYFLSTTAQAEEILSKVGLQNLKLMFDCYHVQLMEGDLSHRLKRLFPIIGHIQFASVPDRGTPDHGEVDFVHIFDCVHKLGYEHPLGAEYKSALPTDQTLGWMKKFKA